MRYNRIVGESVAVCFIAILFSCAPQQPQPIDEADSLSQLQIDEIRQLEQQFVQADIARDLDAVLALRTDDAVWMAPGAPAAEGKVAIRQLLDSGPRTLEFVVTPSRTEGEGSIAYNRGAYTYTGLADSDTIRDRGKYLQIWRREAGTWRIAVDIFNSDQPPPAQPGGN